MKMITCAGCSRPILERYLLNVLDQSWHTDCVHCCECKMRLTEKCFSRDGKLFCKNDFFKHFGTKCAGCFQGVLPTDLVRKARNKVFHLKCFTCLICHKQLSTGEELYIVDENKFICKIDYLNRRNNLPSIISSSSHGLDTTDLDADSPSSEIVDDEDGDDLLPGMGDGTNSSSHLENNHHLSNNQTSSGQSMLSHLSSKSSPMSGASSSMSDSGHGLCMGDTGDSLGGPGSPGLMEHHGSGSACGSIGGGGGSANDENAPGGTKRRGPRTTIKAKQLETLKNAFTATPKPTRHIREQLASETGLNMRVIQVWFQNRRSKERRMKQLSNSMAGRRHFFRSPRRAMRPLRPGLSPHDGLDDSPEMPGGPGSGFGYFTEASAGEYPFASGPGGDGGGPPGAFVPGYTDFGPGSGPDSYSPDSRPFFGYSSHLDTFNGPPPPPGHGPPHGPPGPPQIGGNSMSL